MDNNGSTSFPQQRSLLELKRRFVDSGYAQSYMTEKQLLEGSEDIPESLDSRLTIIKNAILTYRQWVEEWRTSWKGGCFVSLPVLYVFDEWLEQGDEAPFIDITLVEESTLYEPGSYALASQCSELPEALNRIRWLNLAVCRDDKKNGWVIWDYDAVNATLKESLVQCSCLPRQDHSFFLLHMIHNINLCAQQFCPLTRDVAQIETDTRIGALNSMIAIVTDCLTNVHLEKDYRLSNVINELIEIARFSGSEYILFDSLQWFVT